MNCPLCGEEVIFERNLKKHQKGKTCKGFVYERKMYAKGWTYFNTQYRHWLQDVGLPFEVGPQVYIGFGNERYIHVRNRLWVDPLVASILQRRTGIPSFAGPIQVYTFPVADTKQRLRAEAARRRTHNTSTSAR
jgi:hypothetical protein